MINQMLININFNLGSITDDSIIFATVILHFF
jgi:hypothetical protein